MLASFSLQSVVVDSLVLQVGDCIVARGGAYQNKAAPEMPTDVTQLPEDANASDYFWYVLVYLHVFSESHSPSIT